LCTVRRGASPRPINSEIWFSESGHGWIRISDVTSTQGQTLKKTTQYLSDQGVANSVEVDPGDLIMSICGTIGVPKFIGIPACIHDGFVVFRSFSKQLNPNFLYHYLKFISDKLASGGQPGTQKNLNTSIVGQIQVPEIEVEEQQLIAHILNNAEVEEQELGSQSNNLKRQKEALMQQLLTGNRRVKVYNAKTTKVVA
jgi:type I restriction enzyme S subunit